MDGAEGRALTRAAAVPPGEAGPDSIGSPAGHSNRSERAMYILLADDHRLVRDGLKFFLDKLGPEISIIEADTFDDLSISHLCLH